MVERRHNIRYKVSKRAFAVHWSSPAIVGQIIDVSDGGISFSYIEDGTDPGNASDIGILYTKGDFYLEKIPFRCVSNTLIPGHPESTVKMRRIGGEFPSLSPPQKKALNTFIAQHTVAASDTFL